jgi:hypothetical protein
MNLKLKRALTNLSKTPDKVQAAYLLTEGDEDTVDLLGTVKKIEQQLAVFRRNLEAETPTQTTGTKTHIKIPRSCKRSYNNSGLMAAMSTWLNLDGVALIGELVARKIINPIGWRWTETEQALTTAGIPIRKINREVEDGDMKYDIGEVWTDGSAEYTDKI